MVVNEAESSGGSGLSNDRRSSSKIRFDDARGTESRRGGKGPSGGTIPVQRDTINPGLLKNHNLRWLTYEPLRRAETACPRIGPATWSSGSSNIQA